MNKEPSLRLLCVVFLGAHTIYRRSTRRQRAKKLNLKEKKDDIHKTYMCGGWDKDMPPPGRSRRRQKKSPV